MIGVNINNAVRALIKNLCDNETKEQRAYSVDSTINKL